MDYQTRNFRVIGRNTPKVDGVEKVTGRSRFGSDVKLPGTLVARVLRSPHAHARIVRIDTSRAEAMPGVLAVITGNDFPKLTTGERSPHGLVGERECFLSQEVMARGKALFHGHAVAAVAARSSTIAEQALTLIDVEYEALPHVMDPSEAMETDATLLHEDLYTQVSGDKSSTPSNVAEHLVYSRGDIEQGFARADAVVERSFRTQVVHHGYVEPDSEMAFVHSDGKIEVWANTQSTYGQRNDLSAILDIPLSRIKVIPTEVGGGFGGKESVRVSAICVALSRKAGLPVRLTLTREEVFRATGPGNSIVATVKVGAKSDGTIVAIQARLLYDAGAFPGAPLRSAIRRVYSHYRTPNMRIDAYDVVTNKPHGAAYRAPGATPTNFALESVIDELGESLGLDPIEFRLKNVSVDGDPMPDGVRLPTVSFKQVLSKVEGHPCWTSELEGPNRGRGIALGMWTMPGGTSSCHITLSGDGSVTLVLAAVDLSATRTSLAMIAAEALGVDLSDVRVVVGDTDMAAHSDASAGDRITYVAGKAVLIASEDLIGNLKTRVAEEFGLEPGNVQYANKRFWVEGAPEMQISLADLALRSVRGEGGAVMGYGSVSETFSDTAIAPNAAAHVVDVEVDPETGKVDVLRYTTFQDIGTAVNPVQVEGQMQGGAAQGIGWALSEEYQFDDDGAMTNPTLLDYRLQTAADLPFIDANIIEVPSPDHPLGIRAVGQVPIVPPAAALANAIYRATGVRLSRLPMNPERVYWALVEAKKSSE